MRDQKRRVPPPQSSLVSHLACLMCGLLSLCCLFAAGLGVLPFFVTDRVPKDTYMGISNGK